MRCGRQAAGLSWALTSILLLLPSLARGQQQITFQASTPDPTLYRIAIQPGALPVDLSALLDAIATQPGTHAGPITVSPDGNWYVFHSGRFDAGCAGSTCLTIAPSDISSAETILIGGNVIYGDGGVALPGGTAVVYSDGGGPHTRDLWLVTRQGGVWTGPVLLTAASGFDWNYAPALSPDGTKVIFDAGPTSFPSTAIGEVGVDGTGFQVLVTNTGGPPPPFGPSTEAFSGSRAPDDSLVFEAEWVSGGGFSERIWRLPASGGTPALVNGAFSNDNSPCVLQGGRIASLYLGAPPPNSGYHEIKIMDADGTNDFLLTSNGFFPGFVEVDDVGMGCGPAAGGPTPADLIVGQLDAPDPVASGGTVTYTLTVANYGPGTATGVTVTDTPAGGTLLSSSPGPPTCTATAGTLSCSLGTFGPGGNLLVTVAVQAGAPGTLMNTASVSGNEPDPNLPNTSIEPTSIVAAPPGDLVHGSSEVRNLAALPGPVAAEGLFHVHQAPHSSYEIVVDGTGGDTGPAGPSVDRIDATGVLQSSAPIGAGSSRSLRFQNLTFLSIDGQSIRVRSNGCTTSCGPEAVYRIRAYETTYHVARFNNSGTQVSVLVLQNTSTDAVTAQVWFWDTQGSAAGSQALTLSPGQTAVLNTASIAPGTGGSMTVSNNGRYGVLEGKAVAVEPATGFTFDTPLLPRPR